MIEIDNFFAKVAEKNANGTLTVGEAIIGNYYRLREGKYAGRIIIKCGDRIDGREIVRFARELTWIYVDKIANVKCETARPTFNAPQHPIDYSQATWYDDNGGGPRHYEW